MVEEPRLRRLVVVGRHDQQARCAGLLRLPCELRGVRRVVRADAGDDVGAVAHRLDDRPDEALLLLVGGGRRLTGRAGHDDPVAAAVDEMCREGPDGVCVERPVGSERGDHGREHAPERRACRRGTCHSCNLPVRQWPAPGAEPRQPQPPGQTVTGVGQPRRHVFQRQEDDQAHHERDEVDADHRLGHHVEGLQGEHRDDPSAPAQEEHDRGQALEAEKADLCEQQHRRVVQERPR